jgi:hypothetical protein
MLHPFQHGARGQLGAVVADDHRRSAAPGDQRIEFAQDPPAADRGVDLAKNERRRGGLLQR